MNILRDSMWQFIFGILTIGIAVLTYFLQRRKKSLSYQVVSETALLTKKDEGLGEKIKILYEEKSIQSAHLIVLRILNDGNVPILQNDFDNPISFSFGEKTTILGAEVKNALPKTFKPTVAIESVHLVVKPTLLNSSDMVTINILVAGYNNKIECGARIVGVKDIKRVNESFNLSGIYTSVGIIIFITGITLLSSLFSGWANLFIYAAFREWRFVAQFIFFIILISTGLTLILLKMPIRVKDRTRYQ